MREERAEAAGQVALRWTHQCEHWDTDPISSSTSPFAFGEPIEFGLECEAAAKSSKRLHGPKSHVMLCRTRSSWAQHTGARGLWHNFLHLFAFYLLLCWSASNLFVIPCDPRTHNALSTLQFWQYLLALLDLQLTRPEYAILGTIRTDLDRTADPLTVILAACLPRAQRISHWSWRISSSWAINKFIDCDQLRSVTDPEELSVKLTLSDLTDIL